MTDLEIIADGDHIILKNKKDDNMFDTSIANGIKRAVISTSFCYCFTEEIVEAEFEKYNTYFKIKYLQTERNYTVSQSNKYNIQFLSHRLSRIPIYYSEKTAELLESDIYFILTDKDDYRKPYLHKSDEPMRIYSRDLRGIMVSPDKPDDKIVLTEDQMKTLFPYNVYFVTLYKGDFMHFIAKPTIGCSYINTSFIPVAVRYKFIAEKRPDIDETDHLIKSEQNWVHRDTFGNPEHIEVTFEFNGKKDTKMAIIDGINYLIKQLALFKSEYGKSDSTLVIKEPLNENNVLGDNVIPGLQIVKIFNTIPSGSVQAQADDINYLADFTVSNIISSHFLYYVFERMKRVYTSDVEFFKALENVQIGHKKPHPLPRIMEVHIHLQIPDDNKFLQSFSKEVDDATTYNVRTYILDHVLTNVTNYLQRQITAISSFSEKV